MFSYIWRTKEAEETPNFHSKYNVTHLFPMLWIEHCVECAAPLCYKTCTIYKPRSDKRCKRFEYGVAPVENPNGSKGAQLTFRRWAKLEATFQGVGMFCVPVHRINSISNAFNKPGYAIERLMRGISWGKHRPGKVIESFGLIYLRKKEPKEGNSTDGFLTTIYNHEQTELKLMVELLNDEQMIFKRGLTLSTGWNEYFIPIEEIPLHIAGMKRIKVFLEGNQTGTLTIRNLDFVTIEKHLAEVKKQPAKKVKCVAWDLDNTVWEGVIGDAKEGQVNPNVQAIKLMETLDKMGVLQTIVSKNTYEVAWNKLEAMGISHYFLYPAINWGRKSQNLLAIAKELNINIDTFALIDDSVFERQEVKEAIPQMRVYDVTELSSLLNKPEFDIPITEESAKRRESYQIESKRKNIQASYGDDYDSFLKDCQMEMTIFRPSSEEEKTRCLELLQRSNQYNVSKTKRTEDEYYKLYNNPAVSLYAMQVADRYGDYGIVGFVSVSNNESAHQLTDFVMSCRVAQKKVERAFFNWLISNYKAGESLIIDVHKTDRNMPLREELKKMPYHVDADDDSHVVYSYTKTDGIFVNDNIINVAER